MPYRINPFTGELDLVLGPGEGKAATDFNTDSGTAIPTSGGVITMSGGTGINTSGSGSTVTINLDDPVIVDNGGTGRTSLTNGTILVGDGSNPVELIGPLTDGQLLIGDTAGVSPVAATLTAGTGITITNSAGSITLEATGSTAINFDADSGTATPAANTLNIVGSGLVDTAGAGDTITINVDSPVVVANGGTGTTTLTDGGILLGSGTSAVTVTAQPVDGQLLIGSSGTDPVLSTLTAGTGMSIVNASGSITLNSSGGGMTWNVITAASASMAVNNGYISNNAGAVTLTLPATASVGDVFEITGLGAGGWIIGQNAGQLINFGILVTTTGVGGSLASTDNMDSVKIVCTVANTNFNVISSIGNITVV